jgi:hypothetical protein
MDVNSVKRPVIQSTEPTKQPEAQRQARSSAEVQKAAADTPKTQEPKPKPMINSQGQMTGRHLNVSA